MTSSRIAALVVAGLVLVLSAATADERHLGQTLAEALEELRGRGLNVLYSTEIVRPSMRVVNLPTATLPRRILDQLLAPHGLEAHSGPGQSILIVGARHGTPPHRPANPDVGGNEGIAFRDSVVVTARVEPGAEGPASLPVRPQDVMAIAGAADNVFRAVQTLPGVGGTDEFDSRIAVRGGGPEQNLTVMDGIEIHNPFRLLGLASAFNPEIVASFELETGALDLRYGDRLSSVLVIRNRLGDDTRPFGGVAAMSLSDANLTLEGKLPGAERGSWLVTGRRTYYDLVAQHFVDYDLPTFADLQARVAFAPRPSSRLILSGLVSREASNYGERDVEQDWRLRTRGRNGAVSLAFNTSLGARIVARSVGSYYCFRDGIDFSGWLTTNARRSNQLDTLDSAVVDVLFLRRVSTGDWALRQELSAEVSSRHRLDAGFETHRLDNRWRWDVGGERADAFSNGRRLPIDSGLPSVSLPANLDSAQRYSRTGVWLQDRLQASRAFLVQAGVRLDQSSVSGRTTLSPRLTATVSPGSATRLRLTGARQYQSPGYEKLFQSDEFIDLSLARPLGLRSEQALQGSLALERDISSGFNARVALYGRRFANLLVRRLESDEERRTRVARYDFPSSLRSDIPSAPGPTSAPSDEGRGHAYGVEVHLVKRPLASSASAGWISYTYGVAAREAYGRRYPFSYDRRHAFTVVAQARLRPSLSLAVTGRLASGIPRTPVLGPRVATETDDEDRDGDGDRHELVPAVSSAGDLVFNQDFGDISNYNTARLPVFARIDARLTLEPRGPTGRFTLYLDVINLLNRQNAGLIKAYFAPDPSSTRPAVVEERAFWVPFLPTIGARFRF